MSLFAFTLLFIDGIDWALARSIALCDRDVMKDMDANIVLSGGTTMFKGLLERIEKEIPGLARPTTKVKVVAPPERMTSTWTGGSTKVVRPLSTASAFNITISVNNYSLPTSNAQSERLRYTGA